MLNRNGTPPAPRLASGAGALSQPRTEFLPDLPADTWRARLYQVRRLQFLSLPLLRWVYFGLFALALLWPLLEWPGQWAVTILALAAIAALWSIMHGGRRHGFVYFTPAALPSVRPNPMLPAAKIPVYVTGWLHVQNRVRQFAGLPGFYRTFATREHALFCLVRPASAPALLTWPDDEEGLWYAFFYPDQIDDVKAGQVAFGRRTLPGLALDYRPIEVTDGKQGHHPKRATMYLAFAGEAERDKVLADLLVEIDTIQQPGEPQ